MSAERLQVIVRGYADEPFHVWATGFEGGTVVVQSEDGKHEIGAPRSTCHYYGPRLFARLRVAFLGETDPNRIADAWSAAQRIPDRISFTEALDRAMEQLSVADPSAILAPLPDEVRAAG